MITNSFRRFPIKLVALLVRGGYICVTQVACALNAAMRSTFALLFMLCVVCVLVVLRFLVVYF